jgi:hypothetical protein
LFVLQQLAVILAFACNADPMCLSGVHEKLQSLELSTLDVLGVLRDLLQNIGDGTASTSSTGIDSSNKAVLNVWSQTLANFVDQST